jgi:hypothetical protein
MAFRGRDAAGPGPRGPGREVMLPRDHGPSPGPEPAAATGRRQTGRTPADAHTLPGGPARGRTPEAISGGSSATGRPRFWPGSRSHKVRPTPRRPALGEARVHNVAGAAGGVGERRSRRLARVPSGNCGGVAEVTKGQRTASSAATTRTWTKRTKISCAADYTTADRENRRSLPSPDRAPRISSAVGAALVELGRVASGRAVSRDAISTPGQVGILLAGSTWRAGGQGRPGTERYDRDESPGGR